MRERSHDQRLRSRFRLGRKYGKAHSDCQEALDNWYKFAQKADWSSGGIESDRRVIKSQCYTQITALLGDNCVYANHY